MKQGMTFYLHLTEDQGSEPTNYNAEVYSYSDQWGSCWQIQGVVPEMAVQGSTFGTEAFAMFLGQGATHHDDETGNWYSTHTYMATWGTLKVLNPTKNKMSMELSVILFYPDDPDRKGRQDGIQFGKFKEKTSLRRQLLSVARLLVSLIPRKNL